MLPNLRSAFETGQELNRTEPQKLIGEISLTKIMTRHWNFWVTGNITCDDIENGDIKMQTILQTLAFFVSKMGRIMNKI